MRIDSFTLDRALLSSLNVRSVDALPAPSSAGQAGQGLTWPTSGVLRAPSLEDAAFGVGPMVRGHSGPDVVLLQQLLNAFGADPPLVPDGIFGEKTEAALIAFQRRVGIKDDGRFGPGVLAAMQQQPLYDRYAAWQPSVAERYAGANNGERAPLIGKEPPPGTMRLSDLRKVEELRPQNIRVDRSRSSTALDLPWISQFDRRVPGAGSTACYRACRVMMKQAGVGIGVSTANNIQVAVGEDAAGRVRTSQDRTKTARAYIDRELDSGRPVTVGVSHKSGYRGNRDGLTDHYVVIKGRGTDSQGRTFYVANDPSTNDAQKGSSCRFYVDPSTGNLVKEGQMAKGYVIDRRQEVSMVIRNEAA